MSEAAPEASGSGTTKSLTRDARTSVASCEKNFAEA